MGVTSPPATRFEIKSALEEHAKNASVESATPKAASPTSLLDVAAQWMQGLFSPLKLGETEAHAVVIVDPCSTGAVLAMNLHRRGVPLICCWSDVVTDELMDGHVREGMRVPFAASVRHRGELAATTAALRDVGLPVRDVIVGCETGVLLADLLAEELGVRGNGSEKSALRRNKWLQTEAVRAAGLPACGQKLASCAADVEEFLASPDFPTPFKAVVKPVEGAGSDGVYICDSADAVREAFAALEGTKNALGLDNYEVLLQEYLAGDEYVVDTVSRDGVHKCVALWVYDKRVFNGAPVVYYGMRAVDDVATNPLAQAVIRYTLSVIGALGIRNGAVHSEVKATPRGPVLVEANCRLHGGDGQWEPVAKHCFGYSQVSALADAYVAPTAFDALPALPDQLRGFGAEIDLRSTVAGTLAAIDEAAMARIRALPSYISEVLDLKPGDEIRLTVDALTITGGIQIGNTDRAQLEADYELIQQIIDGGLFSVVA